MNPKSWSPFQEAIFDSVSQGTDSLQVQAVAGSGKTTTSVEALSRLQGPKALALAFNKRIQLELEKRLPKGISTKTLNGLGHGAWSKAIGKKLHLDSDKLFTIAKELDFTSNLGEVLALTRAARTQGILHSAFKGQALGLLEDTAENWNSLSDYYDLDSSEDLISMSRDLLLESCHQARSGYIDFDDQIYMPSIFSAPFEQFDFVLVDEAQDLSQVQHKMLKRSLKPGARLMAVGDPHQAIYGFRGADARSMETLASGFSMTSLPLSISYRCPKSIVAEAQSFVSHILAHEAAPEGKVLHWSSWKVSDLPAKCTIVCRNNGPLMTLAWKLISEGRGVTMLGRDIGKGLTKLVARLAPEPMSIEQFKVRLETWAQKEIQKSPKKEEKIRDKTESISALSGAVSDTKQLSALITKLFSSEGNPIVLSSIHRAKGFEWPTVVFLDSFRIPSKYATQDWQKDQETNCAYIAVTRAQETLIYANLEDLKNG